MDGMRVNTEHFPNTPSFPQPFCVLQTKCNTCNTFFYYEIFFHCMSKKITEEKITVVKINRGGWGLDNIFSVFVKFHVKKLDKSVKICELLKHNVVFLSRLETEVEEYSGFLSVAKCCIFCNIIFNRGRIAFILAKCNTNCKKLF